MKEKDLEKQMNDLECGCGYKAKSYGDMFRHLENYHIEQVKEYHKLNVSASDGKG